MKHLHYTLRSKSTIPTTSSVNMADTAAQFDPTGLIVPAFQFANLVGKGIYNWVQNREDKTYSREVSQGGTETSREKPNDILLVLATLGQRLMALDVIEHSVRSEAVQAVRDAFGTGGAQEDDMGTTFDGAGEVVQFAVTCAMVFCAECWPMHMWRGFGCGVLNQMKWANPKDSSVRCQETGNSIAWLKSIPHPWKLLKKSPAKIGRRKPIIEMDRSWSGKRVARNTKSLMSDVVGEYEKGGFPQPRHPYNHIRISGWYFPFAGWNRDSMYEDLGYSVDKLLTSGQADPGRILYTWTVGKRAELRNGEAIALFVGGSEHIGALAEWLEGLNGMNFKVFQDSDMDSVNTSTSPL